MIMECVILASFLSLAYIGTRLYFISEAIDKDIEKQTTDSANADNKNSSDDIHKLIQEKIAQHSDEIQKHTNDKISRIEKFFDNMDTSSISHLENLYDSKLYIKSELDHNKNEDITTLINELISAIKPSLKDNFSIRSIVLDYYYNKVLINASSDTGNNLLMIYAKHTGELLGNVSVLYEISPEIFNHTNNEGKKLTDFLSPENKSHLDSFLLSCQKNSEHSDELVIGEIPQDDALTQIQQPEHTTIE